MMRRMLLALLGLALAVGGVVSARIVSGSSPNVEYDDLAVTTQGNECVTTNTFAYGIPAANDARPYKANTPEAAAQSVTRAGPANGYYQRSVKSSAPGRGEIILAKQEGGRDVAAYQIVEVRPGLWGVLIAKHVAPRDSDGACRVSGFSGQRYQDASEGIEIPPEKAVGN